MRFFLLALLGGVFLMDALPAQAVACRCRIVKSGSRTCGRRDVVVDAGTIAKLPLFQKKKREQCRRACDTHLSQRDAASICAGLKKLGVSLPWSGSVQACARSGIGRNHRGARRTLSCAAGSAPAGLPDHYWKLTFRDEFKGIPAGASAEVRQCYQAQPLCIQMYLSGAETCQQPPGGLDLGQHLRHLDKCTWTVFHRNNTWAPNLSAFDVRHVQVRPELDDGVLILSARAAKPDGTYLPFRARSRRGKQVSTEPYKEPSKFANQYDCRRDSGSSAWKCPFVMGAVSSQRLRPSGLSRGFIQQYGRFDIRAKLPYGPGAYPAIWMLPQLGSWPGAGEIDIHEQHPDAEHVTQTFHTGVCSLDLSKEDLDHEACLRNGGTRYHLYKPVGTKRRQLPRNNRGRFWRSYHVYSVEWTPDRLRFLIDGRIRNEIKNGELRRIRVTDAKGRKRKRFLPMYVPRRPFHFILNHAIHREGKRGLIKERYPNADNFVPQEFRIDYVRAYQRCATQHDFCPRGGTFDASGKQCRGSGATYATPCEHKPYR